MKRFIVMGVAVASSLAWPSSIAIASDSSDLEATQSQACPMMLHEEAMGVDAETLPVPFLPDDALEDVQSILELCTSGSYVDSRSNPLPSPSRLQLEQPGSLTLFETPL